MTSVRIRGIYATALTALLTDAGYEVVQASAPIQERFDDSFETEPADVTIWTTRDRQGIECSGPPEALESLAPVLSALAIDSFQWTSSVPRGAVYDATVRDADGGSGATVDLGDGESGYLRYDDVDGYVDAGNRYRVQVTEPAPPWSDDRPLLEPTVAVEGGLCTLSRDRSGVSAAVRGEVADELVGMTELLAPEPPAGWGLRWQRGATEADLETMQTALEWAIDRAQALEDALADAPDEPGEPNRLTAPWRTDWYWFGHETRLALDKQRRTVTPTMAGHHRIKAADRGASAAVDFVESVCDDLGGTDEFPFAAVSRQFGPAEGDRLEIAHGKPDGRRISLGYGDVTVCEPDGSLTLERELHAGGTYDALGTPKEAGDVAVTKFREGRWWYPTTYKSSAGESKGTYVNICTPVELFPDEARYVDLYVDVIRTPDGTVEVVDREELADAIEEGLVSESLGEKAISVAEAVERALSG